jgi:hypothetical protein
VRAALSGLLLGLTVMYPALAAVLWHALLACAGWCGTGTGWALHQPAGVVALAAAAGGRYAVRIVRRTA